jgi:hypothetical protein
MNVWHAWRRMVVAISLATLTACAAPTIPAAPSPLATPLPTSGKPTSKLTPRLQMLTDSPALRAASAEEQARALGLPPQGPGSLVRDAQARLLVTMRTRDVSDEFQKALRDAGAVVTNVSERYQSVTAFVPIAQLTTVANLPAVQSVQEELAPGVGGGPADGAVFPTPP